MALLPHISGHGFTHFLELQIKFLAQSVLTVHSGLQPTYGSPWYSGRQEHSPLLHTALEPHGDGLHGSLWISVK